MIFSQKDIDKKYTDMVKRYMDMGYWINVNSMSGTQGEKSRVDLTNGKHVLRIMLTITSGLDDELERYMVSTYKLSISEYSDTTNNLLWSNKGNVLFEEWWYEIGNNNKAYTNSKDECIALKKKSLDRRKLNIKRDENYKKLIRYNASIIANIVKKHKGKNFKVKEVIRHTYGYTIKLESAYQTDIFIRFKH